MKEKIMKDTNYGGDEQPERKRRKLTVFWS